MEWDVQNCQQLTQHCKGCLDLLTASIVHWAQYLAGKSRSLGSTCMLLMECFHLTLVMDVHPLDFHAWHSYCICIYSTLGIKSASIVYELTLRTDMSHVRVTVIIYHVPLWDWKRYCQRASATFELRGWILEWLTAVSWLNATILHAKAWITVLVSF